MVSSRIGEPRKLLYPSLLSLLYNGHPSAAGRAQDRVSSPAKDRRSAHCATQPTQMFCGYVTLHCQYTCWWHVACRGRWPHRAPPGHAPAAEKPPPRRRSPPLTATPRPSRALSSRSCCRPGDDGCCSGPTDGGRAAAKTWRHMVSGSCQLSRSLNDD